MNNQKKQMRISKYINRFAKKKVIKQGKRIGMDFKFIKNKKRHQFKESECGMYCLYVIIELLKGKNFKEMIKTRINDKEIKIQTINQGKDVFRGGTGGNSP